MCIFPLWERGTKGDFRKIAMIVLAAMLGVAGASCACHCPAGTKPAVENGVISYATFRCAQGKTIEAVFFNDRVELNLSDGRSMLISQGLSADGARYANTDESFVFWEKGDTAFIEEQGRTTFKDCVMAGGDQASNHMANPASVNCDKRGGHLKILKNVNGDYGVCYFKGNKACEEWALFYGWCPAGGVDTAGVTAVARKYCVWRGGRLSGTPPSVCTLHDGTKCPAKDYYNGTCPAR